MLAIRKVELARGLHTTALGLGCADLFRLPSRRERRRLLEQAFDGGIAHFDTAPMYGLGLSELELGRFARGRRDRIVIVTKFGIAPTLAARSLARGQGPVRRLTRALPGVQRHLRSSARGPSSGGLGSLLYAFTGYSARSAQLSLEASLRRLGTDHVDLFLLHDPRAGDMQAEELSAYLEDARQAGKLLAWGVAGERAPTTEVAGLVGGRSRVVLQLRDDVLTRCGSAPGSGQPGIVSFGVLARPLAAISAHLRTDGDRQARWCSRLGIADAGPDAIVRLLLREAMAANGEGVVLYSTTRSEHLDDAVSTAADAELLAPELEAFRELIREDLIPRIAEEPVS